MDTSQSSRRSFLLASAAASAGVMAPGEALAGLEDDKRDVRPMNEAMPGIFEQEHALLSTPELGRFPGMSESGWETDKMAAQSITTILWAGHLRAARPAERRDPEWREEVDSRLDGMADTLFAAALELEALGPEGFAEIDAELMADPSIFETVRTDLLASAGMVDVSKKVLRQYDRAHKEAVWRIQKQGFKSVADHFSHKLDRLGKRHDVDWRARAKEGADKPFARPTGGSAPTPMPTPDPEATGTQSISARRRYREGDLSVDQMLDLAKKRARTGRILIGLGLGVLVLGVGIGALFGGEGAALGLLVAATPAVVLLIVGLVYLAVVARKWRRRAVLPHDG